MKRNSKNVEHRLLSIIAFCFMLLFTEEYVRHQLPIEYSPALASMWFSSAGILIPGLGFHLVIKFSRLEHKMPRYIYPYIFYLPLIIIFFNIFTNEKVISSHEFIQAGLWKVPVYNTPYYIAMIASIVNNLLYLIPLVKGKGIARQKEHKSILNLMIYGVLISACWFAVFGLFDFSGSLPPYPYLYGGIVWCFFLRHAMKKYDFLNFNDKRYEKLFNLNSSAILIVDLHGNIKEANPSAKLLFGSDSLEYTNCYDILSDEVCKRIKSQQGIKHIETIIYQKDKPINVLIDTDYVLVEYVPHIILILRDITLQKENQREITFLAYHDPLTHLPNRRYFYEKLEEAIQEAKQLHHQLVVILIDLDYFKEVNDRYGHKAGDNLLLQIAENIKETVGHHGMAARLGGDEFVLFIRHVPSVQSVEAFLQQLQLGFKQRVLMFEQMTIPVEMSIGVSHFPEDGEDGDALMNSADKAMYEAKRKRRVDNSNR